MSANKEAAQGKPVHPSPEEVERLLAENARLKEENARHKEASAKASKSAWARTKERKIGRAHV